MLISRVWSKVLRVISGVLRHVCKMLPAQNASPTRGLPGTAGEQRGSSTMKVSALQVPLAETHVNDHYDAFKCF